VLLALHAWWPGGGGAGRARLVDALVFTTGCLLPVVATAAFFALRGASGRSSKLNFLANARWKARVPPGPALRGLVRDGPLVVALAVAGLAAATRRALSLSAPGSGDALIALQALALVAGAS